MMNGFGSERLQTCKLDVDIVLDSKSRLRAKLFPGFTCVGMFFGPSTESD